MYLVPHVSTLHTPLHTNTTHTHIPHIHTQAHKTASHITMPPYTRAHTQRLWPLRSINQGKAFPALFCSLSHCFYPQPTTVGGPRVVPSPSRPTILSLEFSPPCSLPAMPPPLSAPQNSSPTSKSCPWLIPLHRCQVPVTTWLFCTSTEGIICTSPCMVYTYFNIILEAAYWRGWRGWSRTRLGSNPTARSHTVGLWASPSHALSLRSLICGLGIWPLPMLLPFESLSQTKRRHESFH